jgi:hypothetical protein
MVVSTTHSCMALLSLWTRSSPVDVVQLNPLAPEDPHQYEDISKYSAPLAKLPPLHEGSTGEFSVTPCPAYMSTTRSAAHLEAEYEQVSVPAGGSVQGQGSLAPVSVGPDDSQQAHQRSNYENVSAPDKGEKPWNSECGWNCLNEQTNLCEFELVCNYHEVIMTVE